MLSTLDLTGFFGVPGFHQQPHPNPTLALLISMVTKISSYQVNAIKRQGIEQVGSFLRSTFCLISLKVDGGSAHS